MRTLLVVLLLTICCAPSMVIARDTSPTPAKSKGVDQRATSQPSASKDRKTAPSTASKPSADGQPKTMDQFLDRLMVAESDGRLNAKNPRSSALGPFQFIASTWLAVMNQHFPEVARSTPRQKLLRLRTDLKLSRAAAKAYTRDLAQSLENAGVPDTFVNLRLAYLLGPSAGARVLAAKDTALVSRYVRPAALRANPFLRRLTVAGLKARAKRDLDLNADRAMNLKLDARKRRSGPKIRVRCNLSRPSCRRWLALQKRKLKRKTAQRQRKKRR
ncbi:MAG: hypothetical protein AAGG72_07695 [Pseudomonadota bacterium]